MPRPKKPGAPPPKTRSRNGCKPCKARKIKCDEAKPSCLACQKHGDTCDYTVDLKWNGRQKREPDRVTKPGTPTSKQFTFTTGMFTSRPSTSTSTPSMVISPTQTELSSGTSDPIKHELLHAKTPSRSTFTLSATGENEHPSDQILIDPALVSSTLPPIRHHIGHETQHREPSASSSPSERLSTFLGDRESWYDGRQGYGRERLGSAIGHPTQDIRDVHRLSVSSLLSGPPGIPPLTSHSYHPRSDVQDWSVQYRDSNQDITTWGIDRGFVDLDVPNNDDSNAISGASPVALKSHLDMINDQGTPPEFGFGMETSNTAFDSGNYYDKPVPINIPRVLEPLPNKLLENPMNLLYFHHFLNHTAGCLIPHNCSSNPFKSILPQMAVRDDNLLNLLLAYSASHRARLLRQPEPATRIAIYMRDTFPNLRRALDDPNEVISNSTLATAIMLASLEIISPTAFGIEVPWQQHLGIAREIIAVRGGPQSMRSVALNNKVVNFLWSWFAYLDVLGSLSGGKGNASWIFDYECREENEYAIDCILGFTSRCVRLLAKIAELSRATDSDRIGPDLEVRSDWEPSVESRASAKKLEAELIESRLHPIQPCTHMQSTEAAYQWDNTEMSATNEAFHWAGLVHLHRRILGKPSTHHDVQEAVREIFGALYKVRRGSAADVCLLFPMFTAGCETQDEKQRADMLERMTHVETFGMTQVHKARTLMERVWDTGKPWETLVAGEFFG